MTLLAILRILFIIVSTVFWSVPVLLMSFFDPYAERSAHFVCRWAKGILWACGTTIHPRGQEQLQPKHAYLFMSNHQSIFDILAIMVALETFQLRWVTKHELRKVPVFGLCLHRTRQVLVDRESRTQAVATIRNVKALLKAGISVLFFPEGTRSTDGQLLPFKAGGFAVAVETGMPVVPVTVSGGYNILPVGDWKIRSGPMTITFSPPIQIDPSLDKRTARQTLLTQVQAAVTEQHAQHTLDAQHTIDAQQPVAAPPFSSQPSSPSSTASSVPDNRTNL